MCFLPFTHPLLGLQKIVVVVRDITLDRIQRNVSYACHWSHLLLKIKLNIEFKYWKTQGFLKNRYIGTFS